MFGTTLQRMIFWDLFRVFSLSLLGITGIFLIGGIVAEASQQGLGPRQILAIIPLLIPSTLPYTVPATTLFATCVVYGRLAGDNEILAIRASGINLLRIVSPALLLGIMTSLATMTLYYRVIPYTHHLLRSLFLNDVEGLLYSALERNRALNHPQLNYEMYVRGVEGRKLIDPTFKGRSKDGSIEFVAQAREAELLVDMNKRLILVHMKHGNVIGKSEKTQGSFRDESWEVPVPKNLAGNKNNRARDLTWEQLHQRRNNLLEKKQKAEQTLRKLETEIASKGPSQERQQHHNHLKFEILSVWKEILALDAEFQMRPALSVGCLFFVLVGCPVGIWFSRSDYLSSFITCFLPIVLIYYPLVLCGTGLAKDGLDPILAVWAADGFMFLLSIVLFWRLLKH